MPETTDYDYVPQGREEAADRDYERADVSPRNILVATALLLAMLILAHFALNGTLRAFAAHPLGGGLSFFGPQPPPAPRLQSDPQEDFDRLKAEQRQVLLTYGWADAGRTRARIPIERAKALLLQRGLPHVGARPAPSPAPLPEESHAH